MSVVGVSVDAVENNQAMVGKLMLQFPLLSDPEGEVIRAWGVWTDGEGGIARPSIFAVRKDGSIALEYVGTDYADRPSDDELFNSLRGGD